MSQAKINTIKRLYYRATAATIESDLKEAVAILKTLGDESTRARAAVYMDGLSQMRSEWRLEKRRKTRQASSGSLPGTMPHRLAKGRAKR